MSLQDPTQEEQSHLSYAWTRAFGLKGAYCLAIDEEQAVGEPVPRGHFEFANGNALRCAEVHRGSVLHHPPRLVQGGVDVLARAALG